MVKAKYWRNAMVWQWTKPGRVPAKVEWNPGPSRIGPKAPPVAIDAATTEHSGFPKRAHRCIFLPKTNAHAATVG